MAYKVSFFIEGVQAATSYASAALGWTETFYLSRAGLTAIDAALTDVDVNTYISLRRQCLASIYRLAFVRVSDESNPRLFKIRSMHGAAGQLALVGSSGSTPTPAAQVQCSVLVDLVRLPTVAGEITHHRRFLLRGLDTSVINGNIIDITGTAWPKVTAFLNWLAFKESGVALPPVNVGGVVPNTALGIRYHDPSIGFTHPTALTVDAADTHTLVVAPALPVPGVAYPPTRYKVYDVPAPTQAFNRVWTYIGPTLAGAATALGKSRSVLPTLSYTGTLAKIQLVAWVYGLFSQYTIIGLRNKKTGRLFRQLRGRR